METTARIVDALAKVPTQLFIGGQWVDGSLHYELKSPYDGRFVARIPLAQMHFLAHFMNLV